MRAVQLLGPRTFAAVETSRPASFAPGDVEIRLELAAICGSDRPGYLTGVDKWGEQPLGYPVHECIGTVVRAPGNEELVGRRVIAIPNRDGGLSEYFHSPRFKVHELRAGLPLETAIMIQQLATVIAAVERLGEVRGKRVAVLGLGPAGLQFGYLLRQLGVAHLAGFDLRDRSRAPFIEIFDEVRHLPEVGATYEIVVDAVGHDVEVVNLAIETAGHGGRVLIFGVPDQDIYPLRFERFFRKCLELVACVQPDWQVYLPRAEDYLAQHPELGRLVTHVVPVVRVLEAFESAFASNGSGNGKVLISVDEWMDRA